MSATNGNGLNLEGAGGAYLRVSGDRQETERQLASKAAFEKRHGVKMLQHYEDDMPRDLSAKRPDFQRMLKTATSGTLRWIFVDHIDRFGFADEWELVELIQTLRKAGCRLYDSNDEEWTAHGLMSFFKAGLAGHSSHDEQVKKSQRCLGGMVAKARAGEWQGGPPRLGFDVACFDRATGAELWRVVWEGRDSAGTVKRKGKMRPVYSVHRLKVYLDGSTERLDGKVVFRTSKEAQVMRIVPTRDEAKLAAVQGVFSRYATEAVSFFDLAKWLNGLGIRNSFGNTFQSNDIRKMLADEAYLGYPTFRKRRSGRFHRYDADGGIVELEPELRGKDTESDPADRVRSSVRWFSPLVDRPTWDAVQRKLDGRKRTGGGYAPKNPALYLAGLVTCAGCGKPMSARTDRMEFYCGTWDKHRTRGTLAESPCLRNGVRQEALEGYISQYLEETGKRLELLTQGPDGRHLTDHLTEQGAQAHRAFIEGIERLCDYLAQHHPDEYNSICQEYAERANADPSGDGDGCNCASWVGHLDEEQRAAMHRHKGTPATPGGFVDACLAAYRTNFDSEALAAEVERLEAEHTAMMRRYADLPTPRAKEKAKAELAALEERIAGLERQGQDMAGVVEQHFRQLLDLQRAVREAKDAMSSEAGASALRHRAEALRGMLVEVRCEFVVTGKKSSGGPGQAGSKLAAVEFVPIAGDGMRVEANVGERVYGKP